MPNQDLNILVLLRECSDPRPPAKAITRGAGISDRGLRRIANPADLSALEEALRLKDHYGATVTVLAIGPERLDDLLRLAASMGEVRCIRFWDHGLEGSDAVADARVLARLINILAPKLVFTGSRLLDRGDDPVPALAAAMETMPCLATVTDLKLAGSCVEALRKVDRGGRQEVTAPCPCVVQFEDLGVSRYPTVDAVAAAVNAPVTRWHLADLGLPFWEVGATGACLPLAEFGVPRPDPVRVVTPDAQLPTFERILSLLSGGIKAREGKLRTGSADELSAGIWQILQQEGIAP
ncbi:electron transfer flavoprotein subunit beta [Geobacter pelophilus]|uniref:Electron transfer flavoprotein subunit beta n=1 Tax=Geoanaerobacter pelophilus TaxID=60036 RepID=A0AAW4L6F0_9BACT|nr:electron transfer flavoprotein subunit beta [Geoanaerobacter pelophilus]MBT0665127.1 electron transfer flavoprotein subunit beta [Geoanaerobacter pelophilus]